MKKTHFAIILCIFLNTIIIAQSNSNIENVIIVTTDGFRWQEVFKGMDSAIANNHAFNQGDSIGIYSKYWAQTAQQRRSRLLPFLWSTVAEQGQIYGNRDLGVKVNVANPFWFSYPGYSEIFCGYVDPAVNSNNYKPNPNTNLLEFLNKIDRFKGKTAAFGAWDAFDRILNEKHSGFSVVCGYDSCGGPNPDPEQHLINLLKRDAYNPFGEEALDVFTHYEALDYLKKAKPHALYISYGETDEWGHQKHYKDYLDAANKVDKYLNDIWSYIQRNPNYKDKTLLFITVDHGRGNSKISWTDHNSKIIGADEVWFAVIGPQIMAKGEVKNTVQLYQKQYAQTIAELLGLKFQCEHPVSEGFMNILVK